MINCTDNLCKHVQIIVTIENGKTECRLSNLIKKYSSQLSCPCIECIVRSTCSNACELKRIVVDTIHKEQTKMEMFELCEDFNRMYVRPNC